MCCDDGDECISERVQFTIYSMRNSCRKLKWLRVEAFVRESGLFYMEQKPVQQKANPVRSPVCILIIRYM